MAVTGDDYAALTDLTSNIMKEIWATYKDAVMLDKKNVGWPRVKDNQGGGVETNPETGMWRVRIPYLDSINQQAGPTVSNTRHKAGHSTSLNFYFETKMYDATFGITLSAINMTKSNRVAAVNQLSLEMKNLKTRLHSDLSQDYHMDGSGAKAYLPAADNDATFSVVAPAMVEVGHVINILYYTTDTTERITADDAITAVGEPTWSSGLPTQVITITDTPASTAANDFVVISQQADGTAADSTQTGNAGSITGLGAIFNDANPQPGNYGNRDRTSTYTKNVATVHDGNASSIYPYINTTYFRALDRNMMDKLWEAQLLKGGNVDYILCSPAMEREYISMQEMNTNRTPARVTTVDHSISGPEYRGKPLVQDPYCLPCRMYFLDESAVGKKEVWPVMPWPNAESAMMPATNGVFGFTYTLSTRLEVVSGACWKQALLADIFENHHADV
uniref:Uncharacterized protein n=1 Tax=viral metagenome TaxID=1070528 RepID=A0A6M3K2Y7_9ZZZZ